MSTLRRERQCPNMAPGQLCCVPYVLVLFVFGVLCGPWAVYVLGSGHSMCCVFHASKFCMLFIFSVPCANGTIYVVLCKFYILCFTCYLCSVFCVPCSTFHFYVLCALCFIFCVICSVFHVFYVLCARCYLFHIPCSMCLIFHVLHSMYSMFHVPYAVHVPCSNHMGFVCPVFSAFHVPCAMCVSVFHGYRSSDSEFLWSSTVFRFFNISKNVNFEY